jgi:3-oxoadipate enol-lactonase
MRHLRRMDEKVMPSILRGAASSDLPSKDEIHALIVPTLILAWTGDPAHPVSTAEALADLMVMSELHVAEDLAAVRLWPELVREFLAGICQWEAEP